MCFATSVWILVQDKTSAEIKEMIIKQLPQHPIQTIAVNAGASVNVFRFGTDMGEFMETAEGNMFIAFAK